MTYLRNAAAAVAVAAMLGAPELAFASLEPANPLLDPPVEAPASDLTLTFPKNVTLASATVELMDQHRRSIPLDQPQLDANGSNIKVPLRTPLKPGNYVVKWHAVSKEGIPNEGSYVFTVTP